MFGGLGSVFSTALSPIGGLLNGLTGVTDQQDRTYKQQQSAMREQNKYNLAMWNLQNEYNSPASQLARMREAGIDINPTSYALGTGNLSNVASNVSSAGGFSGSGSPAGNPISMAMGVAKGLKDINEVDSRINNLDVDNEIKQHNLTWAKDHNLPVGSVPGMDSTVATVVNKGIEKVKKPAENIYNGVKDRISAEIKRRREWAEKNKDKGFWWKLWNQP